MDFLKIALHPFKITNSLKSVKRELNHA